MGKGNVLHIASAMGFEAIIALLIEKGAVLDNADVEGCTGLHHACSHGRLGSVALLLAKGADFT
jgi:ankyrin repeat protein